MTKDFETQSFIERNRPALFVLASQVVAVTLNAATKVIETSPDAVDPFIILHVRMLIMGVGCTLYLRDTGSLKPESFFGTPDVRCLLLLRVLGGVCSATGFLCTFSQLFYLNHATRQIFL